MPSLFHGLPIAVPQGYEAKEISLTLRKPTATPVGGTAPTPPSAKRLKPNLLVRICHVDPEATLASLSQEISNEIQKTAKGLISKWEKKDFVFRDRGKGTLISFLFQFRGIGLQQYHAIRVEDGLLATLVLTIDPTGLSPATERMYLDSLASLSKPGG